MTTMVSTMLYVCQVSHCEMNHKVYGRKMDSSFMILFYSAINSIVLYALATSNFPFFCIYKTKE